MEAKQVRKQSTYNKGWRDGVRATVAAFGMDIADDDPRLPAPPVPKDVTP